MLDPAAVYQALFGNPQATDLAALQRLRFQRKSILDYVGGSLERFANRVGTEDKDAINRHLQAIRDLERGLDRLPAGQCGGVPVTLDLKDTAQYPNILKAHMDLMVAALSCGVTRVATLQLADALGMSINFGAFVPGVPAKSSSNYKTPYRNWADLAHNPIMNGMDHKQLVDEWFMSRLAELITRMKAIPDAGGTTLFDNSVILWTNTMEEGANKNIAKTPWLLAGRCGKAFNTGFSAPTAGTFTTGVLAAVCAAMNVPGPFGTPTPGLLI
jgi:hypothetical protein